MALVKNGTIVASTFVCSETRTKNKWVAVTRIPAIAKFIEQPASPPETASTSGQPLVIQPAVTSNAAEPKVQSANPFQPANPYAAPATESFPQRSPTRSSAAKTIYEKFQPLNSTVLNWLLRATLFVIAINALFFFCFILRGSTKLPTLVTVGLVTGILQIILLIVTAIFYLRWKYRAYANLQAACVEPLKTSAGWSIAVYFIPIVNLFRPVMVMHEIQSRSKAGIGSLVIAWWILVCLGGILDRIAMTAPGNDNKAGHVVSFAALCMTLIAGYLLLKIIRIVTEKQQRYRRSLAGNLN